MVQISSHRSDKGASPVIPRIPIDAPTHVAQRTTSDEGISFSFYHAMPLRRCSPPKLLPSSPSTPAGSSPTRPRIPGHRQGLSTLGALNGEDMPPRLAERRLTSSRRQGSVTVTFKTCRTTDAVGQQPRSRQDYRGAKRGRAAWGHGIIERLLLYQ